MTANSTINKTDFNYVWECRNANAERDETIPMRKGDYLFICIGADGCASFRYRKCDWRTNSELCAVTKENAALWEGATGRFFPDKGLLTGALKGGERQFTMELTPKKDAPGFSIKCRHFRNPDEGGWDGDDGWGGQQG